MAADTVQQAGSVYIDQLKLISTKDVVFDLTEFLVEFNLYEDMFASCMYGSIVISDSRNLIEIAPIIGEEYITCKITTPTFQESIQKTFRVFKISDRKVVRDNNTQLFTLHFASVELFYDILLPLFVPFEGVISDVAAEIYSNYIATSREYKISESSDEIKELETNTGMVVLNETENKVKFVAPGWTPFKCLNWLATKAIPKDGTSKNYLFFESNKNFYFGSIEHIFRDVSENKNLIGTYTITPSNLREGQATKNINREYFIATDVQMIDTTDHVKNYTNGYLASRLITLDIYNKQYEVHDFDYVQKYKEQFHTSGEGAKARPIFTDDSLRNFTAHISYYPVNPKLYNNFPGNINERMKDIYSNRRSSLLDLTNLKVNITVPGRTDVEVGRMLYFSYPDLGPKDETDKVEVREDRQYSGYYLITAIRHKITKLEHTMTMEIIKDSLLLEND